MDPADEGQSIMFLDQLRGHFAPFLA